MGKFFLRSFFVFQLVLFITLLLTHYIPSISPRDYSIMGILGLFTPILAILNIIFMFGWLLARQFGMAGLAFLGCVVSWNVLSVCFAFNSLKKNDFTKSKSNFSIMSYNVRLLDLFDWTGKVGTRKKMLELMASENPDVLCLQEFYSKDNSGLDNVTAIKKLGGYPYHAESNMKQYKERKWGSVIFSKYPILSNENILINEEDKNLIQGCTIDIKGTKVKVYNIHLHSNKLSSDELVVESEGKVAKVAEAAIKQSKSIFNKLTKAYSQRGNEANLSAFLIQDDINSTPTVVCGDLNDLPSSFSYFTIRGNLKDAFLEKGTGIGSTYNGNISFLRIDYIFFQEQLHLNGFRKIKAPYSDHFPLVANFSLP